MGWHTKGIQSEYEQSSMLYMYQNVIMKPVILFANLNRYIYKGRKKKHEFHF